MKKTYIILLILSIFIVSKTSFAEENLAQNLSGRIVLQIESKGEAWYINPENLKRYYLGRPNDAFNVMHNLGIGITDNNLEKIAIGLQNYNGEDRDNDGLPDNLENSLGTNPLQTDSDNDGYDDFTEIYNNYNPTNNSKLNIDNNFIRKNAGKIFLQVEKNGEAWYVDPITLKRYYLGRPDDAFNIMRELGLGISNDDILKIQIENLNLKNNTSSNKSNSINNSEDIIQKAGEAILQNNKKEAKKYFIPSMHAGLDYTLDILSEDSRLLLGNLLSGSKLISTTENEKNYQNKMYFSLGDYQIPIIFKIRKQENGEWLISNL